MSYRIIVLAPSAGGKSTLMRYMRKNIRLNVAEMDEEIMKANNNVWPENHNHKNQVLIPRITKEIIQRKDIIYISSYAPVELIVEAKQVGFTVILLNLSVNELKKRNSGRMSEEKYGDVSDWFEMQAKGFKQLQAKGLVDQVIDGSKSTEEIAAQITEQL